MKAGIGADTCITDLSRFRVRVIQGTSGCWLLSIVSEGEQATELLQSMLVSSTSWSLAGTTLQPLLTLVSAPGRGTTGSGLPPCLCFLHWACSGQQGSQVATFSTVSSLPAESVSLRDSGGPLVLAGFLCQALKIQPSEVRLRLLSPFPSPEETPQWL